MPDRDYKIPLALAIGDAWPRELVDVVADSPIGEAIAGIGITRIEIEHPARISTTISFGEELALAAPGLDDLEIVFGATGAGESAINVTLSVSEPYYVALEAFPVALRFPRDLLTPAEQVDGEWRAVEDETARVAIGVELSFGFASDAGILVRGTEDILVSQQFMIANSGLVADLPRIELYLSGDRVPPEALPDTWRGVFIPSATLHLPDSIDAPLPGALQFTDCAIGTGGFTGDVAADWSDAPLTARLVGFEASLELLSFSIKQNAFEQSRVKGTIVLPFFENRIGADLTLAGNGNFSALLSASPPRGDERGSDEAPGGLIVLEQEDLLRVTVETIGFERIEGLFAFSLSGDAKPLLGDIDWPTFELRSLKVNELGDVELDGGWIDLPVQFELDFHGFKITLSEVGFGKEDSDTEAGPERHWIGVSGGIELDKGIPLAGSVEGLQVSWNASGPDPDIRVKLEGVEVSLEIPGTLKIAGAVSFSEYDAEDYFGDIMRGQVSVDLMALRMEIAGELIVGKLTDRASGESFDVVFIVLSAEFPTAIPLGATGAGLYGLQGMVGVNIAPDRHADADVPDEPESWYSWYKADRGGDSGRSVTKMQKWKPEIDHYAFGAGLTVGTIYDDGFTVNVRALLAVLIPGPVIIIEGRANLLVSRGDNAQEGAFYALAVIDGNAGTFQLNIDVEYTIESVMSVGGGVEAFFDFNDPRGWYLWLGRKEPKSKRIRAEILSLFQVDLYLMIDNNGIMTGASAALAIRGEYGPVVLALSIGLGFDSAIQWKPPQAEGRLEFLIEIVLKIFGIGLEILIHMLLEARAGTPYWVHGLARFKLSLPFPLPSIDAEVEFTWEEPIQPEAIWPMVKGVELVHPLASELSWIPATEVDSPVMPVVPVDALAIVKFARPVAGRSRRLDAEPGEGILGIDHIDDFAFTYLCERVELFRLDGDSEKLAIYPLDAPDEFDGVTSFDTSPESIVNGIDAQEPEWRLWRYDHYPGASRYGREDQALDSQPCRPVPVEPRRCVSFSLASGRPFGDTFELGDWRFRSRGARLRGGRLDFTNELWIRFPSLQMGVTLRMSGAANILAFAGGEAIPVSQPPQDRADSLYTWELPDGAAVDAIRIRPARSLTAATRVTLDRVCAVERGESEAWSRIDEDTTIDERQLDDGVHPRLMLAPRSLYRIDVHTRVDVSHQGGEASVARRSDGGECRSVRSFFFRTGDGPGAEQLAADRVTALADAAIDAGLSESADDPGPVAARLHYAASRLNAIEPYIEEFCPGPTDDPFYRDLDVRVVFNAAHVPALFAEPQNLDISFRDMNGELVGTRPDDDTPAWGQLAMQFLTAGKQTRLAARERAGCPGTARSVTDNAWFRAGRSIELRPRRRYRAFLDLVAPDGRHPLADTSFVTSSFGRPDDLLHSGLQETAEGDIRQLVHVRDLGEPPFSVRGSAALLDAFTTLENARRLAVAAVATGNLLDSSDRIEEARISRAAFEKAAAEDCAQMIEALGVAPDRRQPERFEVVAHRHGREHVLQLNAPQPFDWGRYRFAIRSDSAARPERLIAVPSADRTTAFLLRESGVAAYPGSGAILDLSYLGDQCPDYATETIGGVAYAPDDLPLPLVFN